MLIFTNQISTLLPHLILCRYFQLIKHFIELSCVMLFIYIFNQINFCLRDNVWNFWAYTNWLKSHLFVVDLKFIQFFPNTSILNTQNKKGHKVFSLNNYLQLNLPLLHFYVSSLFLFIPALAFWFRFSLKLCRYLIYFFLFNIK